MKSLTQAGVFSLGRWGRWGRWAMVSLLAAAVAGCGGGSDPLNLEGGSSDGGGSSVDLRAAYDRVTQCGLTIQEARKVVGREEDDATVYWTWYEESFSEMGKLVIAYSTSADGHFSDTGINRATAVWYSHPKNGVSLGRDLCD